MPDTLRDILGFVINTDLLAQYGWRLLAGLQMTASVVGLSVCLGFLLAWPLSVARMSKNFAVSNIAASYIAVFRGTPLLCQLYLVYYGGGEFRPFFTDMGVWWFFRDAYYCCILTFTLNTAAYQAEILRGAIQSVPKGQIEAARALGLSGIAIMRHVVIPQALLVAIRPLGNELISVIKASALAAIVTLLDLMGQTRFVFARTFDFSIYLYCALIYLALTEVTRRIVEAIETRLSRHIRAGAARTETAGPRQMPLVVTPARTLEPQG
jgi:polar amino acid transport system permease protein